MRLRFNLFWKIFLWLWLTLILFIAVHFLLVAYSQDQLHIELMPDSMSPSFLHMKERPDNFTFPGPPGERQLSPPPFPFFPGELVIKRQRKPPSRTFFFPGEQANKIQRKPPRPDVFFLNKQGSEINGKLVDQVLFLLHNQYLNDQRPRIAYRQRDIFMGPFTVQDNGKTLYAYSHRRLPGLSEERLKILWSQAPKNLLISAILITFPICFALAWFLSSPIRRLQRATREFSSTQKVPTQIIPLLKRGDEFGDLARDFNSMAGQIQDTLESQKRLFSDVSHELRSPLARLLIAVGLVEQRTGSDCSNPHQREINQMILECSRIDSLIEQLLDIARLDGAASSIEMKEFDFCELLREIKNDAELEARQKNLIFCVFTPFQQIIKGSPTLLRSAVENVLRNAILYSPDGSKIEIQLSAADETALLLTVTDQGPGVEEAHIQKIFEPFYRPQYARERNSGGSGLGLAIAKRAIEYHGGNIWAKNAVDGGLQISIRLPREP